MLGTFEPSEHRVTVVGAGVAGLLLARALDRKGFEVTLLEARRSAGGLITTEKTEWGLAEGAAHSFLATPAVLELCGELGVELAFLNRTARARYVVRGGRLRRFPLSPSEAAVALWRAATVRASGARTVGDAALEHLGVAARDYLVQPMFAGIFAARPEELDVRAAWPRLNLKEGRTLAGALLRGRERGGGRAVMAAPREGMGALISALERDLEKRLGSRFQRGQPIEELPAAGNLALCVPAHEAARLIGASSPLAERALREVTYIPMAAVTAFVDQSQLAHAREGVGALIPAREGRRALGVLFNSSAFLGRVTEPKRLASYTVMVGGTARPELAALDDNALRALAREELDAMLGLRGGLAGCVIHRQPRALPLYGSALRVAWGVLAETWCARPGRVLFGNYTGALSIRGMIERRF